MQATSTIAADAAFFKPKESLPSRFPWCKNCLTGGVFSRRKERHMTIVLPQALLRNFPTDSSGEHLLV